LKVRNSPRSALCAVSCLAQGVAAALAYRPRISNGQPYHGLCKKVATFAKQWRGPAVMENSRPF
jgi:L-cysteine desulfidase